MFDTQRKRQILRLGQNPRKSATVMLSINFTKDSPATNAVVSQCRSLEPGVTLATLVAGCMRLLSVKTCAAWNMRCKDPIEIQVRNEFASRKIRKPTIVAMNMRRQGLGNKTWPDLQLGQ